MANKASLLVVGALIGAGAALLCAPRSGQETRAAVAEKVNQAWGEAQNMGEQVKTAGQAAANDGAAAGERVYSQAVNSQVAAKVQPVYESAAAKVAPVYTTVVEKSKELFATATEQASKIAGRASEAVSAARPVVSDDDLRAKIDAARERIAAQVAKNAQEAQASVEQVAPLAAQNLAEDVPAPEPAAEAVTEVAEPVDQPAADAGVDEGAQDQAAQ